ncbi:MAG TPA: ATP-binding protein [Humisphaera sp.]|jgi:signal transduction histidine kinase|nr:ATP-binding protein [Humisphaera sp.]
MAKTSLSNTIDKTGNRARTLAYLIAPLSVGGSVALRYLVNPALHERGRMITFTMAVAISALIGGLGPGLLATLLALITGIFVLSPSPGSVLHSPESVLTLLFLSNSLVICWLSSSRDRANRAARLLTRQLEDRVAERTAVAEQKAIALEESQRQLREQASLLGLILDSIGDAVIVVDEMARPLHYNPAARRLFGAAALDQVTLQRSGQEIGLNELLSQTSARDEEVVLPQDSGKTWLTVGVRPLAGDAPRGAGHSTVAVFHDVTASKTTELQLRKYQMQLRSLASELTLAEQRERRRIAVELHDDIAHLLVMCKLKLSSLNQAVGGSSPDATETFDQIKSALDEAIGYTRTLIFRLSPPVLYELGLEAAVEWLAAQFKSRHGLTVEIQDDRQPKPLGEDVRAALFQSVRELLFNVVKHANSNRAMISLSRSGNEVRVTVQDDGTGFDAQANDPDSQLKGLGLFSIRERIDLLGGKVEVASTAGHGTRVTLTAPIVGDDSANSSDQLPADRDLEHRADAALPRPSHV